MNGRVPGGGGNVLETAPWSLPPGTWVKANSHLILMARSRIGKMSLLKEGVAGGETRPVSTARWNNITYSVMMSSMPGAYLGGAQITHAPMASKSVPFSVTLAVMGPSDTSSYQPSLFANVLTPDGFTPSCLLVGDPEFPQPPRISKRPSTSVRISP